MNEMTTMKKKNKLLDTFEADYAKKKIQAKIEAAKKKLAELAVIIIDGADIMDPPDEEDLGFEVEELDAVITKRFYDQFIKVQAKIKKLEEKLNDN